jgi:hypothetical protein
MAGAYLHDCGKKLQMLATLKIVFSLLLKNIPTFNIFILSMHKRQL